MFKKRRKRQPGKNKKLKTITNLLDDDSGDQKNQEERQSHKEASKKNSKNEKSKKRQILDTQHLENDYEDGPGNNKDDEEENDVDKVSQIIRNMKKRKRGGISAQDTLKVIKNANFGLQNGRDDDLSEYLGKREHKLLERGEVNPNDIANNFKDFQNTQEEEEDDVKQYDDALEKLKKVEQFSRRIKQETKNKAFWSIGMIEVDVDMQKKLETIEKTEQDKRQKLIDEMGKKVAPELYDESQETQDITPFLWKPKNIEKERKKKEKRALNQYLQSFNREGRMYAKRKWYEAFKNKEVREDFHNNN